MAVLPLASDTNHERVTVPVILGAVDEAGQSKSVQTSLKERVTLLVQLSIAVGNAMPMPNVPARKLGSKLVSAQETLKSSQLMVGANLSSILIKPQQILPLTRCFTVAFYV